jgi:non-ribosomal peptide synthetase component F
MESLAQSEQTTPFAILLAVWQTLIFRYSRQDDIVVGVPVAGRLLESVESLVGCCVNTLAMRTVVDGKASFRNHLRLTREKLHANLTHQELPLEHLVNELALGRDLSRTPLFQSVVVQQEPFVSDFAGSGLSVAAVPVHNGGAKFDLVLEATPAGEGYDLMLEFNSDLFLPQTAERMLSHCVNLLQHACRQPETQLLSIPIMEKNEVIEILNLVNREPLGFDNLRCLHREFERRVEKAPTAPALTFELEALSYQDLNQRANRIANQLIAQGVKPGQLVGICLHRSSNLVAAILGVLKAGAAYLPIDLSYPADRIAFMLADAQAAPHRIESCRVASQESSWGNLS